MDLPPLPGDTVPESTVVIVIPAAAEGERVTSDRERAAQPPRHHGDDVPREPALRPANGQGRERAAGHGVESDLPRHAGARRIQARQVDAGPVAQSLESYLAPPDRE